jgi:hypothetical protein
MTVKELLNVLAIFDPEKEVTFKTINPLNGDRFNEEITEIQETDEEIVLI